MGQKEILEFLKSKEKNNKWYSSNEITKHLKGNSVALCLAKLRQFKLVQHKTILPKKGIPAGRYVYKYKEQK